MNKLLFLFLLSTLTLHSCKKDGAVGESKLDSKYIQTLYNISYGSNSRNKLDVALPKNRTTNTPVVVFIHGGAWVLGNKSVFSTEVQKFADEGFACATINYRYASDLNNVHHPELPNDVKKAIDFIASKSEKWEVSPSRFGIVGHSAGGHLSLITTYALNDAKIKACASWAGPLDFVDGDQLAISSSKDVFKTYMGFPLISSTDTLAYKDASPFWKVNNSSVPTLLIYGTDDDGVPYSNAVKMKNKLDSLGIIHSFTALSGAGHIWLGKDLENARNITLNWFRLKL